MFQTLALALVVGAPGLKETEQPTSLFGEWVIEKCTAGGVEQPPEGMSLVHWVFRKDGQRTLIGPDRKEMAGGRYTADPKAGTLNLGSGGVNDDLCRYKVNGDTLMLNVGWPKAPRPTTFESSPGSRCTLLVMKRVKPKD